ncbi:DUF1028 domain-containing protein [Acidisphaera sp. L21]|uniref:DUF1028 domain-containing protein n=1 Tax=Acidisphaera sp. L21 TaxID=1641851 RepID=UPI00131DC3C0|nr:DUF1028 domain-containing protein [Acidisphaera sp. L21]
MTFSIAGLCSRTGEIGAALATSSMAAGARAMFVSPGRGAVFAQARSDPMLGALGLARLEAGDSAEQVLAAMLAAKPDAEFRQIAVLDATGRIAHATGDRCLAPKGAVVDLGAVALGNAVDNDDVIPAILRGFETADGPLAHRLIAALEAGAAAGGEPYPLRSAALKIVRPDVPFAVVDLRVDLAEHPIATLRHHWAAYEPLMEGYLARALTPEQAPLAAAIEGHLRSWPVGTP